MLFHHKCYTNKLKKILTQQYTSVTIKLIKDKAKSR